ncbi:MAG: TetR/AcrR family transcriptional regulator [Actinomycetota bacterium]
MTATSTRRRSREHVEVALITAAADLLGEIGPRAVSVRMIAERAGVNHGLVHHYFGGKAELLRAAMTRLVEEHRDFATEKSGGRAVPAPLALAEDQRYLRAVVRAVLDGDEELATMELSTGYSIPRAALEHLATKRQMVEPDLDTKAKVAMEMALEMGWAALEPFILAVVDVHGDDVDVIRDMVRRRRVHVPAPTS